MNDIRQVPADEDPVCGMHIDLEQAKARGLTLAHDDRQFGFCGKGCQLEFRDDPDRYLASDYQPAM